MSISPARYTGCGWGRISWLSWTACNGNIRQHSESCSCQIKSHLSVSCWVTALCKWGWMARADLAKVLCKNMNVQKQVLIIHTRSTTVFTRSPGPPKNFNVIIHLLLHTYSQLQQKQSHKIYCIITVQTFYYSNTENTVDFLNIYKLKACHFMPLSSNSTQETHGSCFTLSVVFPLCLRALWLQSGELVLSLRSSPIKKKTAAVTVVEGKT